MGDYNYDVKPTANPLTRKELYAGRLVCFADVQTNPNAIGTLQDKDTSGYSGYWKATIDGKLYTFDSNGKCLEDNTKELYGIVTEVPLEFSESSSITRGTGDEETTTTLSSLIPKDQFAMSIMQSLLNSSPNILSMDDAAIMALATKSYKIAQAMLYVGTRVRAADHQSEESEDPVPIDEANLSDNVEKLLYNLNETLKSIKTQEQNNFNTGLKINTISPTVKIDNPTSSDKLNIEGGGGSISYSNLPTMRSKDYNIVEHLVGFYTDGGNKLLGKIDLVSFLDAVRQYIYNYIDYRGRFNISKTDEEEGYWYEDLVRLIDERITTKVKASSLNP